MINPVPDFNLALGDSAIINMAEHWSAYIDCPDEVYTPNIVFAQSNSADILLRSVDEFLIVKAIKYGAYEIDVRGEVNFSSEVCTGSYQSDPLKFSVSVTESPSEVFETGTYGKNGNRIIDIIVEPEEFNFGDTLLFTAILSDTLFFDKNNFHWVIGDYSEDPECEFGLTGTNNTIRFVVPDSTQVINGFLNVGHIKEIGKKAIFTGKSFAAYSQ